MSSFVSFNQFVRHGGHATIVLGLRAIEPAMELKKARLDSTVTDAFEQRLRELAAENWSVLTGAFAHAGIVADPTVEDVETEISRERADFSEQASAIMANTDPSVADADVSTLSDWLARRFLTQINEWRQRRLGVTHFVWRTQDDEKVRAAHAERDDRVYSWQDEFPDGPPGHGYYCRCVAEPAIVDGTILLTDFPTSPDLGERIAQAQADGLTDAAADAAAGGAISVYNLFRFSWLGYRRLFGVITPKEEAERLAMRESLASAIAELAAQGHGPQRHEGAVTRQMLIDRVLLGIDPMTGTSRDGVTGRPHRAPPIASRITSPEAFIAAESFVRRTPEYRAVRDAALFEPAYQRGSFLVVLPLEDVLGPDYLRLVEGVRIADGGAIKADFDRGNLLAVFRHVPGSEPALVTMYPSTR